MDRDRQATACRSAHEQMPLPLAGGRQLRRFFSVTLVGRDLKLDFQNDV
ncbi:MAG: hypothetical protein HGB06_09570, partial [Chlorobaculum sp.]|nr:hypothetical protein [Chlorobaculum sp.]